MSRASWIKPSIKKLIADEAIRNPRESRLGLYLRLKTEIEELGEVAPSEETAYKLISDARRTPRKFDESWTMASLKDNPLPPESIPSVLKVWRYASNTGEKFSLGQAEWVARLYTSFAQISLLWFWSYSYAHEERLSIVTNQEMDSFLLDSNLILSHWERHTLDLTDFREKPIKYRTERFLPEDKDGNIIEELLHGIEQINPSKENLNYNERDHALSHLVWALPPLDTLGFTEEARMVYLRWFTYLVKGPKWSSLSPEDALNVIVQLRQLIRHEQDYRLGLHPAVEQPLNTLTGEQPDLSEFDSAFEIIDGYSTSWPCYLAIVDLLRQVGYEQLPKEVSHERSHHKKK